MNTHKRLVLVSDGGKREEYFINAAQSLGVKIFVYTWDEYLKNYQDGDVVKLDPMEFKETNFDTIIPFSKKYTQYLNEFSQLNNVCFINSPQCLHNALDKIKTRQLLLDAKIPIAQGLAEHIKDYDELIFFMKKYNMHRVFVKPQYGSGAAGVIAFSHINLCKEVLYTSLYEKDGLFFNTKKINKSTDIEVNRRLLNKVLQQNAVVERWIPKAQINRICYDLRVVWILGHIEYIIPRGSYGPITNLHLNNMALSQDDIIISTILKEKINQLCKQTMKCFPGLSYAGLDILIPHNQETQAIIIEVNGQGDLIYLDIYNENIIYKKQIEYMIKKLSDKV